MNLTEFMRAQAEAIRLFEETVGQARDELAKRLTGARSEFLGDETAKATMRYDEGPHLRHEADRG